MTGDEKDGVGCIIFVGIAAVSIATGCLFGAAVGWLAFGVLFICLGLLAAIS